MVIVAKKTSPSEKRRRSGSPFCPSMTPGISLENLISSERQRHSMSIAPFSQAKIFSGGHGFLSALRILTYNIPVISSLHEPQSHGRRSVASGTRRHNVHIWTHTSIPCLPTPVDGNAATIYGLLRALMSLINKLFHVGDRPQTCI